MVLCINCDENFRILTFGIIFDQWPKKKCSNKVKWACFISFCVHSYSKIICIFFTLDVILTHFQHEKGSNKSIWARFRFILFCMHFYSKIICICFTLDVILTHFKHENGSNKSMWARILKFSINFILGFDYFEGASEKSWVLTILKVSKTKLFCLWTDLADFLTQSPLGDVNVKY